MKTSQQAPSSIVEASEIRNAIVSLLDRCNIPFPTVQLDRDFEAACRNEAARRGYPSFITPLITCGVAIASQTYGHLENRSTQIYICLYTALMMYLDDLLDSDVELVREFQNRFIQQRPQGHEVLDRIAELLYELPLHFNTMVSNMILTSSLNAVTAVLVEYDTIGMELQNDAHGYPGYSRFISGFSEAYALMGFPHELPVQSYIQALPEIMTYLNYSNDVLSFYKEEIAGDSTNHVSLLASVHGISKLAALSKIADDAVDAHTRILKILKPHGASFQAYQCLSRGNIAFHAAVPRYRLKELKL